MHEVTVIRSFSAAHSLRGYRGQCETLHGHNWRVELSVAGENLDEVGMVVDFKELKKTLDDVLAQFDHHYLNEISPFDRLNPSSENLARRIFDEAAGRLDSARARVVRCRVWESDDAFSTYAR
jgi:6-pyruvoyltetrahydropterin/6-carboxytetrahydropterin synthase